MYKRKYKKGEVITSLDEISKQEFIYFNDKIMHNGWFCSMQFRNLEHAIKRGMIHYAVLNK